MIDLIAFWHQYCEPYVRARFGKSERGASLVEYALLLALIAVVAIAGLTLLGGNANEKLSDVGGSIGGTGGSVTP